MSHVNALYKRIPHVYSQMPVLFPFPLYDSAGNMTVLPQPKDPTKGYEATYDAWNRLVTLNDSITTLPLERFSYDGLNFRVVTVEYTAGVPSETRHFFHTVGWQTIEERVGSSLAAERQFVWGGRYIDDLILRDMDMDEDGVLDERLYAATDNAFSVVALVDESASVQERYVYSAFGVVTIYDGTMSTIRSTSTMNNNRFFTGQPRETVTHVYCFRNRYFVPEMGTFISRDPLLYPDGPNAYAGWFTPFGMDPLGTSADDPGGDVFGHGWYKCTGSKIESPSIELPFNAGPIQAKVSYAASISTKSCEHCCEDGRIVTDESVTLAVTGKVKVKGSPWSFKQTDPISGVELEGFLGVQVFAELGLAGGGTAKSDRCHYKEGDVLICVSVDGKFGVRVGFQGTLKVGIWRWEYSLYGEGSIKATVTACWHCVTPASCPLKSIKSCLGYNFSFVVSVLIYKGTWEMQDDGFCHSWL